MTNLTTEGERVNGHEPWCNSHELALCSGCSVLKGWDRSGVTGEPTTCREGRPHEWLPKPCSCGPNDQRRGDRRALLAQPTAPGKKWTPAALEEWTPEQWAAALDTARTDLMCAEDFEPSDVAHVMDICAQVLRRPREQGERIEGKRVRCPSCLYEFDDDEPQEQGEQEAVEILRQALQKQHKKTEVGFIYSSGDRFKILEDAMTAAIATLIIHPEQATEEG